MTMPQKQLLRRWRIAGTSAIIIILASTPAALSQRNEDGGRRIYQEQLRVRLDQQQAAARQIGLDAGGWFNFAFFTYDDPLGKERTLRQYELRLWASYTHQGVHRFYVRGIMGFDDWNPSDNPNGDTGDKFRQPRLERAWYRFDYDQLIRNQTGKDPKAGFKVEVGRDFYVMGTGLVLAIPLDAVKLTGRIGDLTVNGLIAKTITHTYNIDDSPAVRDHMDRCFYGIEVKYSGIDKHEMFIYYLWQKDHTKPWGGNPFQQYSYDSRYLGFGSTGSIPYLPKLRYELEMAFESGKSFPELSNEQEKIRAMALDVLLEYIFDAKYHPRVAFQYLWGSGDPDRRLSSNSTIGGNQPGTNDKAFNAFGFRDTGVAFAPDIGNLHTFQLDFSARPLEDIKLFRKMETGTKVFFYTKDKRSGAISDTQATVHSSWVGWEWDAYLNWRITSDVSLTVRYGVFSPGEAFHDRDCRHFLYAGVTYSF